MKFSKKIVLGIAGLMLSSITIADTDADVENGKKLFTESKCNQCHGTNIFIKADRKVLDLEKLESQVRRCDSNLNTNWFDDEIIDVTAHLNKEYYKFK